MHSGAVLWTAPLVLPYARMATPPTFSTPKSRANQPRRFELSPLQKHLILGTVFLVFVALLLVGVYYGTRLNIVQIEEVAVTGGFTISHEAVQGAVWNELGGTYARLVPKRFLYLYPEESIRTSLMSFPRMKQVYIERDGRRLAIAFEEYEPYALWCESDEDETCLFIDNAGYAFSEAPALVGHALLRFRKDNEKPTLRTSVFNSDFLGEVADFADSLEHELGMYVTYIHSEGDYDVTFLVSGGGMIKISQMRPFSESLANLKTILSSEEYAHIQPGNFQYIDLRFGDKVFVNEEQEIVASTTASTSEPEMLSLTESPVTEEATASSTQ